MLQSQVPQAPQRRVGEDSSIVIPLGVGHDNGWWTAARLAVAADTVAAAPELRSHVGSCARVRGGIEDERGGGVVGRAAAIRGGNGAHALRKVANGDIVSECSGVDARGTVHVIPNDDLKVEWQVQGRWRRHRQ